MVIVKIKIKDLAQTFLDPFQVDILELLTGAGIAVTEKDGELSTPLHLAAMRHNHVLVKALLAEDSEAVTSINQGPIVYKYVYPEN